MNKAFQMSTFDDDSFGKLKNKIHVGDTVYAQIKWETDLVDRKIVTEYLHIIIYRDRICTKFVPLNYFFRTTRFRSF